MVPYTPLRKDGKYISQGHAEQRGGRVQVGIQTILVKHVVNSKPDYTSLKYRHESDIIKDLPFIKGKSFIII